MNLLPLQDHSKDDFASLEHLVRTAESSGLTRNDAAKALLRALSDKSRPKWHRFTDTGGAELDEELGTRFGRDVLRHVAHTGDPARWMPNYEYGHELFAGIGPFVTGAMEFMKLGPELGFLLSEIEPFMNAKGVKGFGPGQPALIATEVSGPNGPAVEECSATPPLAQRESAPAAVVSLRVPMVAMVHRTRSGRTDLIRPVIERAIELAGGSLETAVVMAHLERLANFERPPPLEGSDAGGINYLADGKLKTLTLGALGDRLRRAAKGGKTR